MKLPIPEVKYLLRQSFGKETSSTPDKWTPENPAYGHCAVATLIVQDRLGGTIRRGALPKEWADKLGYRSHYWNSIPVSDRFAALQAPLDCSRDQFPKDFPYDDLIAGRLEEKVDYSDKREYVLSFQETKDRYEKLKTRFEEALHSNPLYLDEKFQRCWELAFSENAKCPKMRFGAVVYDGEKLISEEVNRLMTGQFGEPRFCSLDGSECARMNIQSRMDADVGDCGHAPMWSLANIWKLGYKPEDLPRLDFYEAGFKADGSPWWRTEPSYSCTNCQNRFAIFGLDKIMIAFEGQWVPAWTRDSFYSSAQYAVGKKKV